MEERQWLTEEASSKAFKVLVMACQTTEPVPEAGAGHNQRTASTSPIHKCII
jgi:hypothetical protein